MKLPFPRETLVGCVWLPRILAKARLLQRGELPPEYAARFGHVSGVDGQFLRHFDLTREVVLAAAAESDDAAGRWFLSHLGATAADRIEKWNTVAVNLGRPGFPMAERFATAKAVVYPNVDSRAMTTLFEVIEADEKGA